MRVTDTQKLKAAHKQIVGSRAERTLKAGSGFTFVQRFAGVRNQFSAVVYMALGGLLLLGLAAPEQVSADAREKRAQREQVAAEQLHRKMHQEYGGSCGSGLERAGGYPPGLTHHLNRLDSC